MRSGSALTSMSEDRLRAVFAEGAPDWLEEPALREIDAQGVVDRLDTQAFFELMKLPYQSRNERLADFMRRMNICEERGSGIDRVVHEAELFQLPAPRFQSDSLRTTVTVYGPQPFEEMDREDRIRACYQHCALKWVLNERMTNQSLRERFGLPESRAAIASQIIGATIEAGMIKPDEAVGASRKYARYLPFWA
jgi:predicted HTH transcriptional regulator